MKYIPPSLAIILGAAVSAYGIHSGGSVWWAWACIIGILAGCGITVDMAKQESKAARKFAT